ncbi:hypothetical protein ACUN9W_27895 [Escherichia coli]
MDELKKAFRPQFLIGLSAMELVPKFAVGTTVGMCGLFGYVGGSFIANAAIGIIVDRSGWDKARTVSMRVWL